MHFLLPKPQLCFLPLFLLTYKSSTYQMSFLAVIATMPHISITLLFLNCSFCLSFYSHTYNRFRARLLHTKSRWETIKVAERLKQNSEQFTSLIPPPGTLVVFFESIMSYCCKQSQKWVVVIFHEKLLFHRSTFLPKLSQFKQGDWILFG